MKTLKFRFYDKTDKRMKYFDSIWNMPDPSYDSDDIQQFTGLLDKNGVEIYEGDIVTFLYPKDTDKTKGVIKYLYYSWVVQYPDEQYESGYDDIDLAAIAFMRPEVISNIYETPEPLESE